MSMPAHSHRRRISLAEHRPDLIRAYAALDQAVRATLDPALHELVKIRASQLNGCAFCLEMHTREAREEGISDERIDLVAVWREASVFDDRERAALELAEHATLLAEKTLPDERWDAMAALFDPAELAALIMAAVTINGWNRIAVLSRTPVPRRQGSAAPSSA